MFLLITKRYFLGEGTSRGEASCDGSVPDRKGRSTGSAERTGNFSVGWQPLGRKLEKHSEKIKRRVI